MFTDYTKDKMGVISTLADTELDQLVRYLQELDDVPETVVPDDPVADPMMMDTPTAGTSAVTPTPIATVPRGSTACSFSPVNSRQNGADWLLGVGLVAALPPSLAVGAELVEQAVNVQLAGERRQEDVAVGDHGWAELGVVTDGVARLVLLAAPKHLRHVGGVDRVQRSRLRVVPRVLLRYRRPQHARPRRAVGRQRELTSGMARREEFARVSGVFNRCVVESIW